MGRLVVVGSSNTDMIIQVPCLPRPGETILGGKFSMAPGGKGANQAVAAARAGASVCLITRLGRDSFGEQALEGFAIDGIDTRYCSADERMPSGVAQILVSESGENCIGVAPGANATLTCDHLDAAAEAFNGAEAVLLQLETPLDSAEHAAKIGREVGATVILNPAPACELPLSLYPLLNMITPNETEAELLTGVTVNDDTSAQKAADILHKRGVPTVLITRGANGVYMSCSGGSDGPAGEHIPAFMVKAIDTTAAGDVFNGCLAAALSQGDSLHTAVRFAQAAAALSVQVLGAQTSAPDRDIAEAFLESQ